jgi:O-acetyl-ADP-ribose deacetylase (regulator of RNase III)
MSQEQSSLPLIVGKVGTMAAEVVQRFGSTNLILKRGDITREEVDAIVNAANSSLLGGGGVDGAIHRAGGPSLLEECRAIRARQGGCPTGEAVITGAGNLRARYIVHTVGPVWQGGKADEQALLASAYRNSLSLAAAHGVRTIAFPALSTGIYGYPPELAAPVALGVARDYALAQPTFSEIRFVLFSEGSLATFTAALRALGNDAGN